jgi:conjugal transfer ATP-binding protein TraC
MMGVIDAVRSLFGKSNAKTKEGKAEVKAEGEAKAKATREAAFVKSRAEKSELTFNRFSDVLPYVGWDEKSRLFFIEGDKEETIESVGFILEMRPQTGASPEMADYLSTLYMSGAPAGTGIQVQMFGSPDLEQYFKAYDAATVREDMFPDGSVKQQQARLLRKLMLRRTAYYRKGATQGLFTDMNYRMRDFRGIISVIIPVPKKVGGKFQGMSEFMEASGTRAWLNDVTILRETFITTMKSYYLFGHEHKPEDLMNWCSTILNMQRSMSGDRFPLEYDDKKEIRYQIVASDTKITETEADIEFSDDNHAPVVMRAMSIRNYPKQFTLAQMGNLIGSTTNTTLSYPCPFLLTMGVKILEYDVERNKTVLKAARATQGAESPMAKLQPDMIDKKLDWDIAQESFDDGKGTVKLYHQLLLFTNREELAKCEQAAKAICRAENFDIATDKLMQKQALLASLPLMFGPLMQRDLQIAMRSSTKTVYNAANMMPVIGEHVGVGAPVLTLFGRRGQAMGVDIFANPSGNFNGCVVGTSGSGKSFFLNELTQRTLAAGGRVWIIDVGRSYEKLAKLIPGAQYIEFTHSANICLNPFSMIKDLDEDMQMLKPLIAQMISPSRPMEDYELAQLEINIRQLWEEYGDKTSITLLAERLKKACYQGGSKEAFNDEEVDPSMCDPRIRDLGVQLFPFTELGAYGRYFTGPANVEFTSDMVVLELEELNAMKELQSVVMFLLMYKITQEMYLGERSKKLVIIDEAWAVMGSGASGAFIEAGYRRARKYGAAFFTGTQGVGDYYASPSAKAAFDNADWMFMLRQKAESVESLAKSDKLVLDEYTKALIKSVTTRQGAYSEVFVRCGDLPASVGRLFVDPFMLLLGSSKAEDFQAVRSYMEQGLPTEEAIEAVLRDRKVEK